MPIRYAPCLMKQYKKKNNIKSSTLKTSEELIYREFQLKLPLFITFEDEIRFKEQLKIKYLHEDFPIKVIIYFI